MSDRKPAARNKPVRVRLTDYEIRILVLLCQGLTQREVASRLETPTSSINTKMLRIRRRLGVRTNIEAVWISRLTIDQYMGNEDG